MLNIFSVEKQTIAVELVFQCFDACANCMLLSTTGYRFCERYAVCQGWDKIVSAKTKRITPQDQD